MYSFIFVISPKVWYFFANFEKPIHEKKLQLKSLNLQMASFYNLHIGLSLPFVSKKTCRFCPFKTYRPICKALKKIRMWTEFQRVINFNPRVQCEYTMCLKLTIKVSIVYQ